MRSLDTLHQVETPEGIDLQANLAGPVPRALAYAIDISLRGLAVALMAVVLLPMGRAGSGLLLLLTFLLEWFYPVLFEVYRGGQTPGKRWLGLAVVNDDLTPVRWSGSLVRNLLRAADFLPFAYLAGLCSMSASSRFQRLGDMAGGTLVVHRPAPMRALALPDCAAQQPPAGLALEDQIALIDFAQRHQQISADRQRELANTLAGVIGARDEAAVARLRGMGIWLLGAR